MTAEVLWLALAIMLMGFAALAGLTWLVLFIMECVGEHRLYRMESEIQMIDALTEDDRFIVIDMSSGTAYTRNDKVSIARQDKGGGVSSG